MQQQYTNQVRQGHHGHRNARKRPDNGGIRERGQEKANEIDHMKEPDKLGSPQIGYGTIAIIRPCDGRAKRKKQQGERDYIFPYIA